MSSPRVTQHELYSFGGNLMKSETILSPYFVFLFPVCSSSLQAVKNPWSTWLKEDTATVFGRELFYSLIY